MRSQRTHEKRKPVGRTHGTRITRITRITRYARYTRYTHGTRITQKTALAQFDGAAGSVKQLAKIVKQIRRAWPTVRIIVRGDSGFCRKILRNWCDESHVHYVLGLAKNARLQRIFGKELQEAKLQSEATGQASRVFKDFTYQTRKSWSRECRVVSKAKHLAKGSNP